MPDPDRVLRAARRLVARVVPPRDALARFARYRTHRRRRQRIAAGGTALAVAAVGVLAAFSLLGGPERRDLARDGSDLPFPYCAPDATPPPLRPTPWPPDPPGTEWPSGFDPYADALITVSDVQPRREPAGSIQEVRLEIDDVVWITRFRKTAASLASGDVVNSKGDEEALSQARKALSGGRQVLVALVFTYGGDAPTWTLYALDPRGPEVFGAHPSADRATGQLGEFLRWDRNPYRGMNPLDLLAAWNEEADSPDGSSPSRGPIARSWSRFFDQFRPPEYPVPGSREWWDAAPPRCRSVLDAPGGALDGTAARGVWISVPAPWRGLPDAVLCPFTPTLGGAGCASPDLATQGFPYLHWFEVHAVPGHPVLIEVAQEKEAISWVERKVVARISYDEFIRAAAFFVELDPKASPGSYEDVEENSARTRPLDGGENNELLDAIPEARSGG